jgi:hypothetical protein
MASPVYVTDTALNDSDKAMTVPANRRYRPMGGVAQLITTADVGNRQVELRITDGTNTLFAIEANGTQAESLTRQYHFVLGTDAPAAVNGTVFVCPIPMGLWLPPGFTVQILDTATIQPAADDLTLRFLFDSEYS